jgi:hypothetical protein
MRLSALQKFILIKCYNSKSVRIDRKVFLAFYKGISKAKKEIQAKIVTRSLENLIDKEFLVGQGQRTKHKWYIREVSLTRKGKEQAKKLIGEQLSLKFKK